MTGTSINFAGVVVHVRRCPDCDGQGRDFGPYEGSVWLKCDHCVEGLVADEDCDCAACTAHLCMEHYGEVRERCECGTCAPVFVVECHECGTMETPCRMYANRHREPLRCEPCFFKVKP